MSDFKTISQYSGTACFSCNSRERKDHLVCAQCRRVFYCSKKCQAADWRPFHELFCLAWTQTVGTAPLSSHPVLTSFPRSKENLERIMDDLNVQLMAPIRRKLGPRAAKVETGLVFKLPRCLKCLAINPNSPTVESQFTRCSECLVCWCKTEACRVVEEEHERDGLCSALKVNAEDEEYLYGHEHNPELVPSTVWIPPRTVRIETPLPTNWIDYFKSVEIPEHITPLQERLFVRHSLSIPLTIVASLDKFGLLAKFSNAKDPQTLTIHLIGAEKEYEVDYGAPVLEEIIHLLPGVKKLVVVMIGSRLGTGMHESLPVTRCKPCRRRGRSLRVELHPTSYHDFLSSNFDSPPPPDLAVAFNSGICESPVFWLPVVLSLLLSQAPVVFTSLNQVEAVADENAVRAMRRSGVRMVWSAEKAPFPSTRKRFDLFSPEYFWSENMYWFGWKQKHS